MSDSRELPDRVALAAAYLFGKTDQLFTDQVSFFPLYFAIQMMRIDPEFLMGLFDQFEQIPDMPLPVLFTDEAQGALRTLKAILAGELDDITIAGEPDEITSALDAAVGGKPPAS